MKELNFKEGHRARTREPGIQSLEDEAETLNRIFCGKTDGMPSATNQISGLLVS